MRSSDLVSFVVVLCVSAGLSFSLTPLARRLGLRWGLVDVPRGRHLHPHVMAKSGGMALYLAFTLTAILAQFLPVERTDDKEIIRLAGLLLGGAFLFLFGLLDDKRELSALPQYIAQLLAVADHGSIRRAADTPGMPQPGLSKNLRLIDD